MKKNDVLFELTVENIPARFVLIAKKQLQEKLLELMKNSRLEFGDIKIYSTYRRLTVFIYSVSSRTEKVIEKAYGPNARMLKDENGNYTKAAVGFAKACGVKPEELKTAFVEKKGEVLYAQRVIPSINAEKVLSDVFKEAIKSLNFPKSMIWEDSKFVFARPIRNILAIYGTRLIPIEIAGVKSSKFTYSSYFTGFKKISIKKPDEYFNQLDKNCVMADDEKRKKALENIIKGVEERVKATVKKDEDLIEENLYLAEYPSGVLVKFSLDFLKLPKELLNLVLKKQLKFFAILDEKSNLLPFFLGIRDGLSVGHKNVEEGFLNVFKARCADAIFFYDLDLKTDKLIFEEKLKSMLFQKELGNMYDKGLRVRSVVKMLANEFKIYDENLINASKYIYYDLASSVVNEFPELEGIMNYYYANNYGIYDEQIKLAISEIYLPVANDSKMPSNQYSSLFSVAHKIDTLVGDFILGIIPNGSNDPHGLRRYALGIIRTVYENDFNINLKKLIKFSYDSYPDDIRNKKDIKTLEDEILDFIYQRLESYLESKKFGVDVINSVKSIFLKEGDEARAIKRIEVINSLKNIDDFRNFALIYKRLKNITKDFTPKSNIDTTLFEKDEEKKLYDTFIKISEQVNRSINDSDFKTAAMEIIKLREPLESFFNTVLVMVDDEKIKNNRLTMLKNIYNLFIEISDISQISY
jgi:glycyl-tRNA synthetase beta chain